MEVIIILVWVTAIAFAAVHVETFKAGWIIIVGAILFSWIGVGVAWAICEGIGRKVPNTAPAPVAQVQTAVIPTLPPPPKTVNTQEFLDALNKIARLEAAKMLSSEETAKKKADIIATLATQKVTGPADDFLLAIIPMKEVGFLSDNDIQQIKKLLLFSQ